jgi:hypothetical protein
MYEMTPWRPDTPSGDGPGRLSIAGAMQSGWPCRWCFRPLHDTRMTTRCLNCDYPGENS